MDTDFYNSIFSAEGLRVLAVFKGGLGAPPTHFYYSTTEDFLEAAQTYDSLGKNVYHACATYKEQGSRAGDNTYAMKALWVDLDIGEGKPYETKKEAAVHIEQFRRAAGLAKPYMLSSGGGVHVYFPFTRPITPENWKKLATQFAACLDHFGVKHDTSRTGDRASILRVPGTGNYKTEVRRPVEIRTRGEQESAVEIFKKLKAYAAEHGVIVNYKPVGTPAATNDLVGTAEYPPSLGESVAEHCAVLNEVASSGGDVPYEIWWRAIGVAKHTTEPQAVAMHWTRHRADSGHSKDDWESTMEQWGYGPTTCSEFSKHSAKCAACPHNGRIKSPIQLGVPEQPVVAEEVQTAQATAAPVAARQPWVFGAKWIMEGRAKATRTGYTNGRMTMGVQQEDGTYAHVPFCDRYFQVLRRVRCADGVWQLEIGYEGYKGQPYQTFIMDSQAVSAPDQLRKEFSIREMHLIGPKAISKAQALIMYDVNYLYDREEETTVYPKMGWVTHNNTQNGEITGEFVLGNLLFAPKTAPRTVLLEEGMYEPLRAGLRSKGTTSEWVALIDQIYNRPGALAYQFVIASMFAAPLVKLVPGEGDWHGIPIALTGSSGAAKTTTALVAMSMYGPAQALKFSASSGQGGQGDTITAFAAKIGQLSNLPCIADEMTNVEPEKMASIMFMLANGKPKDRCAPNGRLIPNAYRWDMISIATGNDQFHEKLQQLQNQHTQEATQLRCFEIPLKESDLRTVFPDISRSTIEQTLLAEQFGEVGREWIQFLVNNRLKVEDVLGKKRANYKIGKEDRSSIRFYKDLLMTVEVAARLAKHKGFIHWDVDAMMDWAKEQVDRLVNSVFEKDWDSVISDFIASTHGRTIVTKHMSMHKGGRRNHELPLENLSSAQIPVARKALEDKVFLVTTSHLKDWASDHRIMPSELTKQMLKRGYMVLRHGKEAPSKLDIGAGSTVARGRSLCWELQWDKAMGGERSDDAAASNNVVNIAQVSTPAHSESVTDLVTEGGESTAADTTENSASL